MQLLISRRLPLGVAASAAAVFCAALAPHAAHAQAFALYGLSFSGNDLFSINATTGAGTEIGTGLGVTASADGIASNNGSLYLFDTNAQAFRTVSTTTGLAGTTISIGSPGISTQGDFAFTGTGTGFISSSKQSGSTFTNSLYTFNLLTHTTTLLATTGGVELNGLAYDSTTNTLFGLDLGETNSLYKINTATGAVTIVGTGLNEPGGAPGNGIGALTAAPNGQLYASIDDVLYQVNKTTGAATVVNDDGQGDGENNTPSGGYGFGGAYASVSGLSAVAAPEPMSFLFAGLGLVSLAARRRRRK